MSRLRTHNARRRRSTSRDGYALPVCFGQDADGLRWCFEKVRHGKFVRHYPKPFELTEVEE